MGKSFGKWKPGEVFDYGKDYGPGGTGLWDNYNGGTKSGGSLSCYATHPPLKLGDHVIYGGSCINPVVKDADIYIGLDHGMYVSNRSYPWAEDPRVEVFFPITDRQAPKDPVEFRKMVDWVCNQLQSGKKIHAGCIGGHGRTGTLLAAVTNVMLGEKDAIDYVRKNYCPKAVESHTQMDFLKKHYGITPAPVKEYTSTKAMGASNWPKNYDSEGNRTKRASSSATLFNERYGFKELEEVKPVAARGNIWGEGKHSLSFDKVG